MVTTSTLNVTDSDIYYYTPEDFGGEYSNHPVLTTAATVSGNNDDIELGYDYNSGAFVSNDTILVTGGNDYIYDGGDHALINAQGATSSYYNGTEVGLEVYGPGSTVYGSGANDWIRSDGEYETVASSTGTTVAAGTHTTTNTASVEVGNFLYGGAGDDHIEFATADTVYGGAGNDLIVFYDTVTVPSSLLGASSLGAFISGDGGDNTINMTGSLGYDTVYGGTGNDTIEVFSNSGFEHLYGQTGNDTISVTGGSNDIIFGGAGNDDIVVTGSSGYHFISGDNGNDTIDLSDSGIGFNTVYGGASDDTIYGSTGYGDQLYGQTGNDTIYLNGDDGTIYGGAGNDLLYDNNHFNSFISGDLGDDSIFASGVNDTLYGGDGNDSILASGANDQLYGQAGNDHLIFDAHTAAATAATIYGGAGDDMITVSYADHQVAGSYSGGAETVNGATYDNSSYTQTVATDGVGSHFLSGDLGNDTIIGGSGGDTFVGGAGTDELISHRLEAQNAGSGAGTPGYLAGGAADDFVFFQNDSVGGNPASAGTGSDISTGAGEGGIDHITGFELNITGQAYVASTAVAATPQSYINHQDGDNLYFFTGTHANDTIADATADHNVFYGTVTNTIPASTATEASDYAVAYAYAFGTGGTASAETADAHFAAAVDFIAVNVTESTATQNGNIFVFDHNGNAVVLNGAALPSTGTAAGDEGTVAGNTFQNSQSPSGGIVDAPGTSVVTINIYH